MDECVNKKSTIFNTFLALFDDKSKGDVKWWNRNYFYVGTVLIVILNILIFAFVKESPWEIVPIEKKYGMWTSPLYFDPTICGFLSAFFHLNWQHVLLNMLCFFVAGLYLERKMGTFGIILFVIFGAYIAEVAVQGNNLSVYSVGFSGVNYFIYATIIIDYIFSYQKYRRNKTNVILGSIEIALIYFAMCFNGGTESVSFKIYPYDLIHNMGHYASFLVGLVLGLFAEAIRFVTRKSILDHNKSSIADIKTDKAE